MILLKITCIKAYGDKDSFKFAKAFGFDVFEIQDLDNIDVNIKELINNNYNTIFLTNEVAGFSEDIIKKYKNSDVTILISPSKRNNEY